MDAWQLNGRYQVVRSLARGGFGQTFLATDATRAGQWCVVKQLRPQTQDPAVLNVARRLFHVEIATLRQLGSHDQIPALLDDFEMAGEFYLVQEFIDGIPLNERLATQTLTESEAIGLLRDLLHVLEFVHQHQVIHRDVKPSNVICRSDGRYVLIDFGAVKALTTQLTSLADQGDPANQTVLTIGIHSEGYAPSEQIAGKPRYNSDLYALGMTTIQALTGLQPMQLPTHPETGDVIWRDRTSVSPWLGNLLDRMVRYHFHQRFQSATEVLAVLDQPDANATQLPVEWVEGLPTPTAGTVLEGPSSGWVDRVRSVGWRLVGWRLGMSTILSLGLVGGGQQMGLFQPLELALYDRLVQHTPNPDPDPRLLVVEITEADIQAEQRFPLSDRTLARAIAILQAAQPKVIGLDLWRDIPQPPGTPELRTALQAPNTIAITKLADANAPEIPPPPGVPKERVGFNDLVLDPGRIVRRALLLADTPTHDTMAAFSLQMAIHYLGQPLSGVPSDPMAFRLGTATIRPLESHSGGYHQLDAQGYQILLRYRGRSPARTVSLSTLLQGNVPAEWIRGKAVLIGTTAPSAKDGFLTPYHTNAPDQPLMSGVLIHAQILSHLLSLATGEQPAEQVWKAPQEWLWLGGWTVMAGMLAVSQRRGALLVSLSSCVGFVGLAGCYLWNCHIWVPIATPISAIALSSSLVHWGDRSPRKRETTGQPFIKS